MVGTVEEAIGYFPLALVDKGSPGNLFIIFGKQVENNNFKVPLALESLYEPARAGVPSRILTDDWPYLYVSPGILDIPYLIIVLEMLLLACLAGRKLYSGLNNVGNQQMFFLGAAFMLLELQSISRLSLLYGATWLTSAIVIIGVLTMIFLANVAILKVGSVSWLNQRFLYLALTVALLASYFCPYHAILMSEPMGHAGSYLVITCVTLLPVLWASSIFAQAFKNVRNPGMALGFNLFGAFCGSMLEYLSNYCGINGLVIVALGLYMLSYMVILNKVEDRRLDFTTHFK